MAEEIEGIRHVYTLLCDHAITEANGKHSLIGLFRTIRVPSFPGSIPRFYIATALQGGNLVGKSVRIELGSARGKWKSEVATAAVNSVGPPPDAPESENDPRVNGVSFFIGVVGLEFPEPGQYEVRMFLDDQPFHTEPFGVVRKNNADSDSDGS